jgi:hypothetical protein
MKKNRSIIIIALVLVAAAVALLMQNHYSTLKKYETGFSVSDTASITKIFIADKSVNSIILNRRGKQWFINDKQLANQKIVNTLLSTLKKIKVKSPVSLASHNSVIRRMSSIGKKVEIYQNVYFIDIFGIQMFKHEKLTKVFFVGDVTKDNLGTYMLMEGAERPFIVYLPGFRGFVSTRFSPMSDDWLSHVVFSKKLADIKSLRLSFTEKDSSSFELKVKDAMGNYEITRLLDGSKVKSYDTLKVLNMLTSFADLRYESRLNNILLPQTKDSIIHSPTLFEITLVGTDDDTTFVKTFKKNRIPEAIANQYEKLMPVDHDRFYGLINHGEDFVLMQYYVFDKVLHPLDYYLN